MTDITKCAASKIALSDIHAPIRKTVIAGEAIDAGSPAYIESTGLAYMCVSGECGVLAANVSKYDGFVINDTESGESVTLFGVGTRIHISDAGLQEGDFYFVSGNKGELATTSQLANDTYLPVAKAITDSDIIVVRTK
jgi:hypothetical protein